MLVLGFYSKDKKSIVRLSPTHSQPHLSRLCANSLGPSIQYIPLGVYHTGDTGKSTLWTKMAESNHNTDIPSTPSDNAGCFPTSSSWEQDLTMQTCPVWNKTVFSESAASVVNDHGKDSKDRKSTRDKANVSNPKVNRGCAPLTANHTSADCVQISLGPSIPYIPQVGYHTGGIQRYEPKWPSLIITRTFHRSPPMMRDAFLPPHHESRI